MKAHRYQCVCTHFFLAIYILFTLVVVSLASMFHCNGIFTDKLHFCLSTILFFCHPLGGHYMLAVLD